MADIAIDFLERQWLELAQRPRGNQHHGDVLGWMQTAFAESLEHGVEPSTYFRGEPLGALVTAGHAQQLLAPSSRRAGRRGSDTPCRHVLTDRPGS